MKPRGGRLLIGMLSACAAASISFSAPPPASTGDSAVERARYTMGGITATVRIEDPGVDANGHARTPDETAALAETALDGIDAVDRAASLYKEDSDLVRVNAHAWPGPCQVGPLLADLLDISLRIAKATRGRFDPTVKPLMDYLGFYREIGSRPDPAGLGSALGRVGWKRVSLDRERGLVRFGRAGMAIDLGGVGKGYALDRAAAVLRQAGVRRAGIELGRSWLYIGRDPDQADGRFRLAVAVPDEEGAETFRAVVAVPEGSVATSSPWAQVRQDSGRRVGHIVDPRRGPLETGVIAATVWAREGVEADALTKPLVVEGPAALHRLRRRFQLEAMLFLSGAPEDADLADLVACDTPRAGAGSEALYILATPGMKCVPSESVP
jgi:thiamine biosynthesis lipoprotein